VSEALYEQRYSFGNKLHLMAFVIADSAWILLAGKLALYYDIVNGYSSAFRHSGCLLFT